MIKFANDHIIIFTNIDEPMRILRKILENYGDIPTKLLTSQLLISLR